MAHALTMMLLTGAGVVTAGVLLGWSADWIASATGLGELWTGWVLLAGATSVPEFVTDTSAVRIHAANLAAGDLFGSSLTNMAILAVLALTFASSGPERNDVVQHSSPDLFNTGLAILLTILGASFTLFHPDIGIRGLRPESLSLLLIWIVGTRVLYRRQQSRSRSLVAIRPARDNVRDPSSAIWAILIFTCAP